MAVTLAAAASIRAGRPRIEYRDDVDDEAGQPAGPGQAPPVAASVGTSSDESAIAG
jgi:hypothetical protein